MRERHLVGDPRRHERQQFGRQCLLQRRQRIAESGELAGQRQRTARAGDCRRRDEVLSVGADVRQAGDDGGGERAGCGQWTVFEGQRLRW
jgi:hypothetical protein